MNWKRSLPLGLAACLLAAVCAVDTGCSDTTETPPRVDAGADAGAEIVVGVSDALTGGLAGLGAPLKNAIAVAEHNINAAGGVLGKRVRFKVVDDASDKGKALEVVRGLMSENVAGLLGPLSSGQVLNVQQEVFARKLVQLSATATSPLLTSAQPAKDRYFFRTAAPDDLQGKAVAKFIYDGVAPSGGGPDAGMLGGGCRKLALVNGDDGYGNALAKVVKDSFGARAGAQVVYEHKVATTLAADYKLEAQGIVQALPDCLVLVVYSDVGARLLRDLKAGIAADTANAAKWAKFFVSGTDGAYDADFIPKGRKDPSDPKSENSTEGTFGTAPDPAPDTTDYKQFENLYKTRFPGETPAPYTAHQFDAAVLLALAIQKAGTTSDGTKIRDALFDVSKGGTAFSPAQLSDAISAIRNGIDIDYSGASGACDFDDYGNVVGDYVIWNVKKQGDGTFAYVSVARVPAKDL